MSTKKLEKKVEMSVEILYRNGEVTITGSNGEIITIQTNDLAVALGAVFAQTMSEAVEFWRKRVRYFDVRQEITAFENHG